MASHFQLSEDYILEAWLRVPVHRLQMIAPSSVVGMVVQCHNNHPGLYPDPSYDSYRMNHALTSSLPELPVSDEIHWSSDSQYSWSVHLNTPYVVWFPPQNVCHYTYVGWFPPQDTRNMVAYSDYSTINHHQQIIDSHDIIDLPLLRSCSADNFSDYEERDAVGNRNGGGRLSEEAMSTRTATEEIPFYYEQSDEIDWCRPRNTWNINQDYTYFNLFGSVAREDFTINQLLANPEEFVNGDLFPHHGKPSDYEKSDKICVICEKDEHKERIARLDCGHGYHVYCMENWLQHWNICPLCKFDALGFPNNSRS